MFETACHQFDLELATLLSNQRHNEDSDFGDHITLLIRNEAVLQNISEKKIKLNETEEEMNWYIISGGDPEIVNNQYIPTIEQIKDEINALEILNNDFINMKIGNFFFTF